LPSKHHRMKQLYFTILATFSSLILFAQQPDFVKAFSLQDAIQYALQNNNDAKNAKLEVDKARWRNWEIKSAGLPTITAGVDYTYYFKQPIFPAADILFNDPNSPTTQVFGYLSQFDPNIRQILYNSAIASKDQKISFVLPHNLSTNIQLTQVILDGRYFIGLKATRDFTRAARLQKDLSDQDVKYNIMKAYYQAQAASESKAYLTDVKDLVQKLTNDTRKIYKEGLTEELDVNRLELALTNLESQINTTNQLAEVALANMKFQMGLNLTDAIILTESISTLRDKVDPQIVNNFQATQRIEYEMLETAVRIRGYDVQQRRSGHFPSLVGFLNYGWQAQVNKFGDLGKKTETTYPDGDVIRKSPWFQSGIVGLKLSIPIFDSGNRLANVQQGKLDEQKQKNDFENFQRAAALQVQSSQAFFTQAINEEFYTKKSVELSEKIFKTTNVKFKEGIGNSFELVQAQQDLIQNKLKYIQAQVGLLNTKADMDKALGVR
jgi:outer membrane protein